MTRPAHRLANLFPLIAADELDALAADIRQHGLREPVILTPAGEILDGRNRLRACEIGGVEPVFETIGLPENEWQAWVLSKNLTRRHLTTAQRAAIANELAKAKRGGDRMSDHSVKSQNGRPPALTVGEASSALKVSPETVHRIRAVERKAEPGLIDLVKGGQISIGEAETIAGMIAPAQRRLIETGPDAIKQAVREARSSITKPAPASPAPKPAAPGIKHAAPPALFALLTEGQITSDDFEIIKDRMSPAAIDALTRLGAGQVKAKADQLRSTPVAEGQPRDAETLTIDTQTNAPVSDESKTASLVTAAKTLAYGMADHLSFPLTDKTGRDLQSIENYIRAASAHLEKQSLAIGQKGQQHEVRAIAFRVRHRNCARDRLREFVRPHD